TRISLPDIVAVPSISRSASVAGHVASAGDVGQFPPVAEQRGLYICPERDLAGLDTTADFPYPRTHFAAALTAHGRKVVLHLWCGEPADQYRAQQRDVALTVGDLLRGGRVRHGHVGRLLQA